MNTPNLCLGTAKLDDPSYGYSSKSHYENISKFLQKLNETQFSSIDTAPRYRNSEQLIGKYINLKKLDYFISTKIEGLSANNQNTPDLMLSSIINSKKNLKVDFIDLCYLHQNEIEIISDKYVIKGINLLKEYGHIKEIGTSIYYDDELDYTISSGNYDWVQIPINILDTYFYEKAIKYNKKIKIAARSVFLQGLLFTNPINIINNRFKNTIIKDIKLLKNQLEDYNLDFKMIATSYISSLQRLEMIIIGSRSIQNLKDFENFSSIKINSEIEHMINKYSSTKKKWTNPRNWN